LATTCCEHARAARNRSAAAPQSGGRGMDGGVVLLERDLSASF
jgi:hypothetical protein